MGRRDRMNRVQAERLLRNNGFEYREGTKHDHWHKNGIWIGLARGVLTTDAEAAIKRKIKKANRVQ